MTDQPTVKEMLERLDDGWSAFSAAVHRLPAERLEGRLGENAWTRKQMLAHIAMWHDLTIDRLAEQADTGKPAASEEDEDGVNARAARNAVGRTTGEVILALDESFRRLRREIARLSNEQLAADESWAASVIAANTWRHYSEHLPDLDTR
ncbi:MAG TPA: DinB family protein [Candidatus Limnocylindrales bacterium]